MEQDKIQEDEGVSMEQNKIQERKTAVLFAVFFKIGLFTFGGGYAMIPLIQRELAQKKRWIEEKEILDVVAIAESTPGSIAVNAATFVGQRVCGFPGALAATTGVVCPSFLIILAVSCVLRQFEELQLVQYAFYGIRAGVLALIVNAMISMYRQCPKERSAWLIGGFALIGIAVLQWNVLLVILLSALAGIAALMMEKKGERG